MATNVNLANIALDINNFLALMWNDLEKNNYAEMPNFYTEDGIYDTKGILRIEGRKAFLAYAEKARQLPKKTSRHLLSNHHFDFTEWEAKQEVTLHAVMTFYGGSGTGVLTSAPPLAIYDTTFRLRKGGKFGWMAVSQVFETIMSATPQMLQEYMRGS